MTGVIAFITLLHVLGWGVLVLLVIPTGIPLGGGGGTLVTLGVGLTAYALGVRHAFDADHIAAIDNTTRRLAERGKPANTVGFWFSLGHSTIVVVLCILLTLGVTAIGTSLADDASALRTWTGIIGPTVSGLFLIVIAAINTASLRRRRHGHAGGPVLRMLGPFEKAVDRPSRMYLVGLLFGLGFDTATEIGLLALAGTATLVAVPWWAALTLPILFAAGMSAFDTTQGAVMRRAYTWQPGRRHLGEVYAITMTGLSVVAAALIAIVQLADVLANLGLGGPFSSLASVGIGELGFVLTGLLLVIWATVLFVGRDRTRRQRL